MLYLVGVAEYRVLVCVEERRDAAEQLKHKRFSVHYVKLLNGELDRTSHERITLVIGIDAQYRRNDERIPATTTTTNCNLFFQY